MKSIYEIRKMTINELGKQVMDIPKNLDSFSDTLRIKAYTELLTIPLPKKDEFRNKLKRFKHPIIPGKFKIAH